MDIDECYYQSKNSLIRKDKNNKCRISDKSNNNTAEIRDTSVTTNKLTETSTSHVPSDDAIDRLKNKLKDVNNDMEDISYYIEDETITSHWLKLKKETAFNEYRDPNAQYDVIDLMQSSSDTNTNSDTSDDNISDLQ